MNPNPNPNPNPERDPRPETQPMPFLPPARPEYYRDPRLKSPLTATLLSLVPGVGQVYLGYTKLGFLHGAAAAVFVCLMSTNRLGLLEPLVGVFMAFFYLYNLVDAYRRTLLLNEAALRMEAPELPEDFGGIPARFRLSAGLALIFLGLIGVLNLHFHISMAWLEHWWPAGLVLLGLYLVVRAVKDRRADVQA